MQVLVEFGPSSASSDSLFEVGHNRHKLLAQLVELGHALFAGGLDVIEHDGFCRDEIVGDVRGKGLLLGVDLVADAGATGKKSPLTGLGKRLTEKLRDQGLLLRCGDNAISMGPPLCFTREDVDQVVDGLDRAFGEI